MDWVVIGTVAEIVGSTAVVISLIYLGVQIKHANRQSEIESLRNTWGELNQICDKFSESKEIASIINRGRSSLDSLDADESLMFEHIHLRLLNTLESWYLQVTRISGPGPYRNQQIENLGEIVSGYIDHPGARALWRRLRHYFQPIAELVERKLSQESGAGKSAIS